LRASTESTTSKLERITLQLEGYQTANAELEHMNADLKRTEVDLKRQLDKWQNLETKGGAEVDAMRKRRIELEVQVKELQKRLDDAGKEDIESAKVLEKEKRKVDKLKAILLEWKVCPCFFFGDQLSETLP
jgi:predicted RNase H-like nuclease (RuvC/YqgF family)